MEHLYGKEIIQLGRYCNRINGKSREWKSERKIWDFSENKLPCTHPGKTPWTGQEKNTEVTCLEGT